MLLRAQCCCSESMLRATCVLGDVAIAQLNGDTSLYLSNGDGVAITGSMTAPVSSSTHVHCVLVLCCAEIAGSKL